MALTRLFHRPAAPPSPGHRDALERSLLARFDALHPQAQEKTMLVPTTLWRAALLTGLLLAAGGASQVPADYQAEIGKRIQFRSDAPLGREQVQAVEKALSAGREFQQVQVRVMTRGDGVFDTVLEIFGDTVSLKDVAGIVRREVPALAALPITVTPIERTVHGDMGDVAARWAGKDRLPPEELKKLIEAEVAASQPGAKVDVDVKDSEKGREVRVKVERQTTDDEHGSEATPPPTPPNPPAPPKGR